MNCLTLERNAKQDRELKCARLMKILFFGKKNHWSTKRCVKFLSVMDCEFVCFFGERGDDFPTSFGLLDYDVIISFSSPWIIPKYLLKKAKLCAINFHPASPEYPGIGCTNFALYDEKTEFGVCCHHMVEKVDTGDIIGVKRFPIFKTDSVESVTKRSYFHMFAMFIEIMSEIIVTGKTPESDEVWAREAYTRKDLNDLGKITLDMSAEEVERRYRAMKYKSYPGAYIDFANFRFEVQSDD